MRRTAIIGWLAVALLAIAGWVHAEAAPTEKAPAEAGQAEAKKTDDAPAKPAPKAPAKKGPLALKAVPVARHAVGAWGGMAARDLAYDPTSRSLLVLDTSRGVLILDLSDPVSPTPLGVIPMSGATSVTARDGLVALTVPDPYGVNNGTVRFYNVSALSEGSVTVGVSPQKALFTPDGTKLIVTNRGDANDRYKVDSEGSISIVYLANGLAQAGVKNLGFQEWNRHRNVLAANGVRIVAPNATVAQDMEPGGVALSQDGATAYVALQSNNALAVVDVNAAKVKTIQSFGVQHHDKEGRGFDASDKDGRIHIANWPVLGMIQPHAIIACDFDGGTALLTANEGRPRWTRSANEVKRVSELRLDPKAFPNAKALQADDALGRLEVSTVGADPDNDGDVDRLFSFGARSFSIWRLDDNGGLVELFDSGDGFEQTTARELPENFNSNTVSNHSFDLQSPERGPRPMGLALGRLRNRTFAFITLHEVGGVIIYDVTNPSHAKYQSYVNTRGFQAMMNENASEDLAEAGDVGPEAILFINDQETLTGKPLLIVASSTSGTVTVYRLSFGDELPPPVVLHQSDTPQPVYQELNDAPLPEVQTYEMDIQ